MTSWDSVNLKPLKPNPKTYPIVGFDCETEGVNNDFTLGTVSDWKSSYWFKDKDEMMGWLLQHRYRDARIFATNLVFDLFALNPEPNEHWELMFNGSNMFAALYWDKKYPRKKGEKTYMVKAHWWRFLDTLNLNYHMSVEKMGKVIGLPKVKKPDFLGEHPSCEDEWQELYVYCQRDSEITRAFMEWFQDVLNGLGARLKYTAPSVAMDFWRMKYLKNPIKQPDGDILPLFYEGYYGGRTEVFRKGTFDVDNGDDYLYYYDVNSLYPKIMRDEPYPDVDTIKYRKPPNYDWDEDWLNLEGISKVTVIAPMMHVPLLAYRQWGKTLFPVGEFSGVWAHNELRYAVSLGYKIVGWEWTIYYDDTAEYFKGFVTDLYNLRLEHQADDNPVEIIDKFLMNSMHGKFALKLDGDAGTFKPIANYITKCDNPYSLCWMVCERDCLTGKTIYKDKWVVEGFGYTPSYVNPILSIYTTAGARVLMHGYLADNDELIYTDTDSFISPRKYPTGSGLGKLKLEATIERGTFIRPKLYELITVDIPLPKIFIPQPYELYQKNRAKGIPGKALIELFNNMKNGDPQVTYEKFLRFKEAQVRRLPVNRKVMITKHLDITSIGDKREPLREIDVFHDWTDTIPHVFGDITA